MIELGGISHFAAIIVAVAVFVAFPNTGDRSKGWFLHPISSFTTWWNDYKTLLNQAKELERKSEENDRRAARKTGGWRVSPIQAFQNIRDSIADPGVSRLVKETMSSTPWSLVAVVLLVSLGGSYVVIKRASVMAELFDVMTHSATNADEAEKTSDFTPWQQCVSLLISFVMLYLLDEVIDVVSAILTDELRMQIELRARKAFFAAILAQDIAYLDRKKMTDLQRHLQDAPFAIYDAALVPARLVRYAFTFAAGLYSMFYVDWQMSIVAWLFRMPLTLNLSSVAYNLLASHWRLAEEMNSRSTAQINEALSHIRLIQTYTAEEIEANAYAALLSEGHRTSSTLRVVERWVARLQNLLHLLWDAGSLGFASWRIINKHMTIGSFNAFKTYQNTTSSSFESLLHETSRLRMSARKCETYFDILDNKPLVLRTENINDEQLAALKQQAKPHADVTPTTVVRTTPAIRGEVEFRDVSFRYPTNGQNTASETQTLQEISFHVPAGKTVAFVGASGAGKSTLLRLLVRFYEVGSGSILIDGQDIRNMDARHIRRNVGFVEQEPTMLNRSIRDNICFGFDPKAPDYPTQKLLEQAAKRAHIHDTIMSFPDGYNTIVGERGVRLSGGEKQRIAVARAFIRNPRILLLDEPTAALDAESETQVKAGIEQLMEGRTVLIIAHRLRTVQAADCIFVMEAGRVVEQGSHDVLLHKRGHYYTLVSQQTIALQSDPAPITEDTSRKEME